VLGGTRNQFSLTCGALITGGRIKSKFLPVGMLAFIGYLLPFLIPFCLCSCANSLAVKEAEDLRKDEAVVFGSIITKPHISRYTMFIMRDKSPRLDSYHVKSDGGFYWHLKPGKYTISSFGSNAGYGRIWVKFEVPNGCDAVYIGTLNVALGGLSNIDIIDQMDAASSELAKKFPASTSRIAKSIMRKE
jgi:hypothetical protein